MQNQEHDQQHKSLQILANCGTEYLKGLDPMARSMVEPQVQAALNILGNAIGKLQQAEMEIAEAIASGQEKEAPKSKKAKTDS